MQCPQFLALAADDRGVGQPHQAHRRAGVAGIAVLLHVAGEEHVLAVGRDVAAVDVPAVLAVDQPPGLALGVGHPQLRPAVAVVALLAGRPVGEDDLPAVREPVGRAAIDAADGVGLAGGRRSCGRCSSRCRRSSPRRRATGRRATRSVAGRSPCVPVCGRPAASAMSTKEIALDRETGDLLAVRAPTRPGILSALAVDLGARAVAIGEDELSLLAVVVAADRLARAAAADRAACDRRGRTAARLRCSRACA